MEFLMNGTAAEAAIAGRTIGDVLAELDERAEAMGAIIVEVDLNGRSLSPEELAEACAGSADGPGTVSLIAESAAGLKARGLESLLELVRAASEATASGDDEAAASARAAWKSFQAGFAGIFSAEEASFVEAFGERLESGGPTAELSRLSEGMTAFFGERLAELRDPEEAMLAAARIFDAIKDDLSEVPVRLQTGKDADAMRTMVLAVELINKTVRIMPEYARESARAPTEISGVAIPEFYGQLNGVLKELAQAFEDKDGVLIGDLAEYEIRPRLDSFYAAVRAAVGDR